MPSRFRIAATAVAVTALAAPLVACGSSADDTPEAAAPPLTAHPCDVFGPEAQAAAGIDGSEPERYEDRDEPFQRWACSFRSDNPYSLALVSFNGTSMDRVDDDDRLTRVEETEIAGHRTVVDDFPGGLQCVASVDFDPNVLEVMVGYPQGDIETPEQACPLALQVAKDLAPYFPEHL